MQSLDPPWRWVVADRFEVRRGCNIGPQRQIQGEEGKRVKTAQTTKASGKKGQQAIKRLRGVVQRQRFIKLRGIIVIVQFHSTGVKNKIVGHTTKGASMERRGAAAPIRVRGRHQALPERRRSPSAMRRAARHPLPRLRRPALALGARRVWVHPQEVTTLGSLGGRPR